MKVQKNRAVTLHFRLEDSQGELIHSTESTGPMPYLHGHGNLVKGVERALEGREVGEIFQVVVPPEDGYGMPDPRLNVEIPLSAFPAEVIGQLAPGVEFEGPHPRDQRQFAMFTVAELLPDAVRCSANHPLAGKVLHFTLEVVDIREGTSSEVVQGHIAGSRAPGV